MLTLRRLGSRVAGPLGLAVGGLIAFSLALLWLSSTQGEPFATLSDAAVGLAAVASAALAAALYPSHRRLWGWLGVAELVAALVGAAIVVAGVAGAVSGSPDPERARRLVQLGGGLIGLWLIGANTLALQNGAWPRGTALWGLVAGVLMAAGLAGGVALGLGMPPDGAGWVAVAGQAAAIGGFVLYPLWALLFGRAMLAPEERFVAGV